MITNSDSLVKIKFLKRCFSTRAMIDGRVPSLEEGKPAADPGKDHSKPVQTAQSNGHRLGLSYSTAGTSKAWIHAGFGAVSGHGCRGHGAHCRGVHASGRLCTARVVFTTSTLA